MFGCLGVPRVESIFKAGKNLSPYKDSSISCCTGSGAVSSAYYSLGLVLDMLSAEVVL